MIGRYERVIVRSIDILLNSTTNGVIKVFFNQADILLLPDPPFSAMLTFLQVPLIECSFKFSVHSFPNWIEERRTHYFKFFKLGERYFFRLRRCHIDHMNDLKRG